MDDRVKDIKIDASAIRDNIGARLAQEAKNDRRTLRTKERPEDAERRAMGMAYGVGLY